MSFDGDPTLPSVVDTINVQIYIPEFDIQVSWTLLIFLIKFGKLPEMSDRWQRRVDLGHQAESDCISATSTFFSQVFFQIFRAFSFGQ